MTDENPVPRRRPRCANADPGWKNAINRSEGASVTTMPAGGHVKNDGPTTLPELLRLLDVNDQPVGKQWYPILDWLTQNPPNAPLWRSLLRNGYGLQLEQAIPGFQRPIPIRRITSTTGGIRGNALLL